MCGVPLRDSGTRFRSLTEAVNTITAAGRMMMQMERSQMMQAMLKERTKTGLDAACEKVASANATRSSPTNSRLRFKRWSPRATRLPTRALRDGQALRLVTILRIVRTMLHSLNESKASMLRQLKLHIHFARPPGTFAGAVPDNPPVGLRLRSILIRTETNLTIS
jgi:hypothetical protein